MKSKITSTINRFRSHLNFFKRDILDIGKGRTSFSQYGEDMIIRAIFARYPHTYKGFYVDVGAYHPTRFSNTRYFYNNSWRGICIDPLPTAAKLFARHRPRDIFVQAGVSEIEDDMVYYMFKEPAYNSFSDSVATKHSGQFIRKLTVKTSTLSNILRKSLPTGKSIDFLSVDAEGFDLQVLKSNDWDVYRPKLVVVEYDYNKDSNSVQNSQDVFSFMDQIGYLIHSQTPKALFFLDSHSPSYEGGPFLKCLFHG